MTTEPILIIGLDEENLNLLIAQERENEIKKQVGQFNVVISCLVSALQRLSDKKQGWIQIENKDVFYHTGVNAIFPNFANFIIGSSYAGSGFSKKDFKNKFAGYVGRLPTIDEIKLIYSEDTFEFLEEAFLFKNLSNTYFTVEGRTNPGDFVVNREGEDMFQWDVHGKWTSNIPVHPLQPTNSMAGCLAQLVMENLIPMDMGSKELSLLNDLRRFYQINKAVLKMENNQLIFDVAAIVEQDEITSLLFNSFDIADIKKKVTAEQPICVSPEIEAELRKKVIDQLLNVDKKRASLLEYNIKMLEDPNRGHWDARLAVEYGEHKLQLSQPIFYRPPQLDVKKNGTVGIDFGTKSTVVMYQEKRDQIMPMRIGTGNYLESVNAKQYENPTVLNFLDLLSFQTAYRATKGRPDTKWEDLTSSHTAYESMKAQQSSDSFYSFLNELKQWTTYKNQSTRIIDKKTDMVLQDYLHLRPGDFDPIEVYAYFIGTYINNMHKSGAIYLDYVLSHPATCETAVRNKLAGSFSRGIKKSLPIAILEDEELMKKFKVRIGASEPVAYAVCAMEQFGFEPEEDEPPVRYGIFDFGGGTTDFDFGIFRAADCVTEEHFDYVIESFGDSGDKTLGGENILQLMAFEVFKANKAKLLHLGPDKKNYISFFAPEDSKDFLGSEVLISDSQAAKVNMSKLIEELRPFWEVGNDADTVETVCFDEYGEEIVETAKSAPQTRVTIAELLLLDNDGNQQNCNITIDRTMLETVISDRIEIGVMSFLESMSSAMNFPANPDKVEEVHVFLAGNASKSPVLKELLERHILLRAQKWQKDNADVLLPTFKIYPPLGTEEAKKIQKERGVTGLTETSPTGKTGVAYGIVRTRPGGKIKVSREVKSKGDIRFKYYIGNVRRNKFRATSNREIGYNTWFYLIDASEEDFTIYFTESPLAQEGTLTANNVDFHKASLPDTFDDGYIFYRAVAPQKIEYVVAEKNEDGSKGKDLTQPVIVVLGE